MAFGTVLRRHHLGCLQKETPYPLGSAAYSPAQPLVTPPLCVLMLWKRPFWMFLINGPSLTLMFLRCLHVAAHIGISLLFKGNGPLHVKPHLFILSSVDGHWGCVLLSAIVNSDA